MGRQLDAMMAEFKREFKQDVLFRGIHYRKTGDKIPFSSPRLNYMTYGGLVRGSVNEFFGEENGGKTTTAIDIAKNAQILFDQEFAAGLKELEKKLKNAKNKNEIKSIEREIEIYRGGEPKSVAYFDIENSLQRAWCITLGMNVDKVYYYASLTTDSAESVLQKIYDMVKTGELGLVVIDSIGALLTQKQIDGNVDEVQYAGISKPLTTFCNKIKPLLKDVDCTLIAINQRRDDINNPHNLYNTPGGRSFKHACETRFNFRKGPLFDEKNNEIKRSSETPCGNFVQVDFAKNKVCPFNRKTGFYTLNYRTGIDYMNDFVDVAIKLGMIVQAGAWFNLLEPETMALMEDAEGNEIKLQGKPNCVKFLVDNPIIYKDLKQAIDKAIVEIK